MKPHARWVRISHGIATMSFITLAFTGFVILMAHPRLYWGEAGNDLTPALIELPISPNYQHGGWDNGNRTYVIFNQNAWGRSLHFLAAWLLVLPGTLYLVAGILGGHFRAHVWPRMKELAPHHVWREVFDHLRMRIKPATGGPDYGLLQKCMYSFVIFIAAPVIALTGLTMSPAVTAGFPILLRFFGGYQSARTIHFCTFVVLFLFLLVHVLMVVKSGFKRQIRAITWGE